MKKLTNSPIILSFLVFSLLNINRVNSQIQIGSDIDGAVLNDHFGAAVSMPDNFTIAIGGANHSGARGHVRIYRLVDTIWQQKGIDIDGEAVGDESGRSISMSDSNTVAIGAILNDGNGTNSGHVRIYSWNGISWQQKGIPILGDSINDNFGFSVSMPDSNTVAISAPNNDENGMNAGHVKIYKWNGSAWQKKGNSIEGKFAGDNSGWSVSMPDSNSIAIGSIRNNSGGINAGHVRVFKWNGMRWQQKGLDIIGEAVGDLSGNSVSMPDSNTVAIGAPTNDGNDADAGHVRIYRWNGVNWEQKGSDIDGKYRYDWFGTSVSMPSANIVAVGSPHFFFNPFSTIGYASIFTFCLPDTNSQVVNSCNSFTWIDNITYTSSTNTPIFNLPNSMGCDSVITLNLTINSTDTSITKNNDTLSVNQSGAAYQWLNCDSSFIAVNGATKQFFSPSKNGFYACEISLNGCIDTTACVFVIITGINKNELANKFKFYPNPFTNELTIEAIENKQITFIEVMNVEGQKIYENKASLSGKTSINTTDWAKGIYLIRLTNEAGVGTFKMVHQ